LDIRNILISQPEPASGKSSYLDIAEKIDANVTFRKFIHTEGIKPKEFREQRICLLDHSAVVITNSAAVDNFFQLAEKLRVEIPNEMRYFCLSESVAHYLQKYIVYRKRKIFFSKDGKVEGLMTEMKRYKTNNKFLVPLAENHSPDIPNTFKKNGFDFSVAVMFRTVSSDLSDLDIEKKDMILFFSPLGIDSLKNNFPDFKQGNRLIGVFGSGTEKAAEAAGFKIDIVAPNPKAPSMAMALEQHFDI
jgi:uroporphyrinogen-III synthase